MINFSKEKTHLYSYNLQTAITKKTKNTSLSGKSLGKLVSITNSFHEFKNGETAFIIRGVHFSNVNYVNISNSTKPIKTIKTSKDNLFIKSRIDSWEVNGNELLKTNYKPKEGKQLCVKQSSADINRNKTTGYYSNVVTSLARENNVTKKKAILNINDQIKYDCRFYLNDEKRFK